MKKAAIKSLASYIPNRKIDNLFIESRLEKNGLNVPHGILENTMGSALRFYASEAEQASDLAALAANKILQRFPKEDVDLLIFAAASSDLAEPATASIVQAKTGLSCPAFDLKNACNSMTNAIEVACAFICLGHYRNILIASGEKTSVSVKFDISDSIELRERFASYSFGDAGFALLLGESEHGEGFEYHRQITYGEYWPLCTVKGGGTMSPQKANQLYFCGKTFELSNQFIRLAPKFVNACLDEAGYKIEQIDLVCTHQVSKHTFNYIAKFLNVNIDKIVNTFQLYGNTAATSLPLSLQHAIDHGLVSRGDLIMLLGLAAGINISVQLLRM
jgi:3-oxoacyl-[acyl-carrier-protein] synthase-3